MDPTTTTLGDLARTHGSATRVFLRHHLDVCCAGRQTLAEACGRAGLDATQIARELAAARVPSDEPDWSTRSPSELADHIVARYHARLREEVPPLLEAARKVERVHAGKPAVPAGLADVLAALWGKLESHMTKEERVLFPMLRRGARGRQVYTPVRVMEAEHDAHGRDLARILTLTGDLAIPEHACATWRALYEGLARLEAELMEHIHLENNVLFQRAVHEEQG